VQHHAALAGVDDVEAAGQPDDSTTTSRAPMPPPNCRGLMDRRSRRGVAAIAATAALLAEEAGKATIEITPQIFEIGRALVPPLACRHPGWLPQPWSLRDMSIPAITGLMVLGGKGSDGKPSRAFGTVS
jgi:hypothetical protein